MNLNCIDQSPAIDFHLMRALLESVAAINLEDLAHELLANHSEIPALAEAIDDPDSPVGPLGNGMAIAFKTGRRYGIMQAIELLHPDITPAPESAEKALTGVAHLINATHHI
jgi:hypothetical protein